MLSTPRSKGPRSGPEGAASRLAAIIGCGVQGAALARELAGEGARTRADLRRPATLARLPRAAQASVLFDPARNVPLAAAAAIAAEAKRRLVFDLGDGRPRRCEVAVVGSIRRQAPFIKDIDLLVTIPAELEGRLERVLAAAALRPPRAGDRITLADTYAAGARRRSLILQAAAGGRGRNYRTDLFVTTEAERPYALYHYTGPRSFNIRGRAHVKRRGWLLNQYGLFNAASRRRIPGSGVRTERELAALIGVTYQPPARRV